MKRYKFKSSLTPEEILNRVMQSAQPETRASGYSFIGGQLYCYIYGGDSFWLMKTPRMPFNGQLRFRAELTAEADGGTVITGRFTQSRAVKRMSALFTLIAPVFLLVMGGIGFLPAAILFWLFGIAIVYLVFYIFPSLVCRKQNREVIALVKERLLG